MSKKNQITLINCYIGDFPWYFNFFVKSCEFNPTIRFLVFSNSRFQGKLPENLNIIPFDLDDFNEVASRKLGFKIKVVQPYKLTDFKPAFGLIFSNYLTESDYWGFCDLDIIFGRIPEFFTDEELLSSEIFSARREYPSGFFMLFKNTKELNNLFKKSRDYKKVFKSDIHYCFDECNFKHDCLMKGMDIFDVDSEIESMHHVIMRESASGDLKISFKMRAVEGIPGDLMWKNGLLTYKSDYEVLLYHLINYKTNIYARAYRGFYIPNSFSIGIYSLKANSIPNPLNALSFLYFEKVRPAFARVCHKIDFVISLLFRKENNIPEIIGKYRYWDHIAFINKSGLLQLIFSSRNVAKNSVLFRSRFKREKVFVLEKPNVEIRLEKNTEGALDYFLWIDNIGNTRKYKKLCGFK